MKLKSIFHSLTVVVLVSTLLWSPQLPSAQAAGNAPILLIVNDAYGANPFGRYLGEILRAEGLNEFDVIDLSALSASELANHQVALLAETSLSAAQALTLTTYVNGGGRLIAMRPDAQIKGLFGLGTAGGTLTEGYLKFDTTQTVASGLTTSRLQLHGDADQYTAASTAITVAQLYTGSTPLPYPAVVLTSTGRAAAFTYDLARNVAYTRQGNPASANKIFGSIYLTDTQGITGTWDTANPPVTRTTSLFQLSNVLTAPAWIDRDLIPVPQADEQQRLLARLLRSVVADQMPLPQLWYFPGTAKTMLILTGDAHGQNFDAYQTELTSLNNYSGTISLYMSIGGTLSDTAMLDFISQGHDFGIHPYAYRLDGYAPYSSTTLATGYTAIDTWWGDLHSAITQSHTVRNHQIAWEGWTTAADIAAGSGIRLDTNFYHWGTWLQKANGAWPRGYITGSGLPMKFVRTDGTFTSVYQQLTELVDEHLLVGGVGENLTSAQAIAVSQNMMDASLNGDYAALMTQFHLDYYGSAQTWAEGTMAYANANGIPIWNAEKWLNFTELRHDAEYSNIAWDAGTRTLSFSVTATNTAGLTLTHQLPLVYGGYGLSAVTLDSSPYTYTVQTIKDQATAFISASAGNHDFTITYAGPLPGGSLTQTTYADFGAVCAALSNTHDSDVNGGAVTLAATFADDFTGPLNGTRWTAGAFPSGPYTPTFASGQITLPPVGRIQSTGTYTSGVVEAVAEFGAGLDQHIGFDDGSFTSKHLLFSTDGSSSHLYARVNNNGSEQNLNLGVIPSGMHRYRIEWVSGVTTDTASFYMDGAFVYSTTVAHFTNPLGLYVANDGAADLKSDSIQIAPPYITSGTYTSCALDAGVNMGWQTASWDAITTSGALTVEARTSFDGVTWGNWNTVASNGGSLGVSARYGQYRLSLSSTTTTTTPVVNSVTLGYGPTAVQMSKADNAATAAVGEAVNHTFTLTVPQTTTYGLVISDVLPTGVLYATGSWAAPNISPAPTLTVSAPNDGSAPVTVTWDFGDAVFATSPATLTFSSILANVSGNQAGTLRSDSATLAYENSYGAPQTPLTATDSVTVTEPIVTVSKATTAAPSPADAGGVAQYRATLAHPGGANTSTAYDVVFTDTLPAGLTLNAPLTVTLSGGAAAYTDTSAGNTVTITIGSMPAGGGATIDYTATLSQSVAPSEIITNTGYLAWTSRPGANANERIGAGGVNDYAANDPASITIADPALGKGLTATSAAHTSGANVTPGEVLTYTLFITLPEGTTTGLQIVDNIPVGLTFVPGSVSLDTSGFNGNVVTPTVAGAGGSGVDVTLDFAPITVTGDNVTSNDAFAVSLQARVMDVGSNANGTSLTNAATLQVGSGALFNSNDVTATVVEPVLTLSKSVAPTSAAATDVVTVTLIATNTGTSNAYDVALTDLLSATKFSNYTAVTTPPGFTFGTGTAGSNAQVTFTGGTITATQAATFVFTASLTSSVVPFETLTDTASLTGTSLPGADANERAISAMDASATLSVIVPDLAVSKTDGLGSLIPSQLSTYTITITNNGQRGATGVLVTDTLPLSATYQSSSHSGAHNAGVVTWPAFSLAAGASVTRSVTLQLASPVLAGVTQITNTVTVRDDGVHGVDPTSGDNTVTDTDTVTAAPEMQLTKGDGGLSAVPGTIFTYTLTYTNAGDQNATGVTITETIPANTTFNSSASTPGWSCAATCSISIGAVAGGNTSGTVKFAVNVTLPAPSGVASLSNSAGIADDGANGADTNTGNNVANLTTPLNAAPDFVIAKTDGGASATPGSVITYTLRYTNTGTQNAVNVRITETVPNHTTFNSANSTNGWSCTGGEVAGTTCTFNISTLAGNGGSGSVVFAAQVNNPVAAGVSAISNAVSIADDGSNGADPNTSNNTANDSTPVTAAPDLSLAKTDGGAPMSSGDTLVYHLLYANIGNQGATGVVVTDTVPSNARFAAASSSGTWSCPDGSGAGTACSTTIGTLAGGGASASVDFAVVITNPFPSGVTQLSNTASVSDDGANGGDANFANNTATLTTTVTAAPELRLTVTDGNLTTVPGALVTYTLYYSNSAAPLPNGIQNATGVNVTFTVPSHSAFVSGTPGWNCASQPCFLSVGNLNGGASGQLTFTVQVNNPLAAGVTQLAANGGIDDNHSNGADPSPGNNAASESTPVTADSDLQITQSDGVTSTVPGATITYTLNYTNAGNQNADGVTLTETFPANTSFNATASSAGWTCGGQACTLSLGTVTGGASGTRVLVVTVDNPIAAGVTSLTNLAGLNDNGANGADLNPSDNTAAPDVNTVDAAPDLALFKTDEGLPTVPGLHLTYRLVYTNTGNQAATGVLITETVPVSTTFSADDSTPGWSCAHNSPAGTTCVYTATSPFAGGGHSASVNFVVHVADPVPATLFFINNTATIGDDGANGAEGNLADNTSADSTPLQSSSALRLSKTDGGVTVTPGALLTYTLTYTNLGNTDANSVVITETVPAHTSFNAAASTAGWACVSGTCTFAVSGPVAAYVGTGTVRFVVTVDNPIPAGVFTLTNIASIGDDGAHPEPTPGDNTATETTPVTGLPNLGLRITTSAASVSAGDVLTFTLVYSNSGNRGASGVVLTTTVPTDTTFLPANSDPAWVCVGSTCTLSAGTVAGGGAETSVLFVVQVAQPLTPGTTGFILNAAIGDDGLNGADTNSTDNAASASVLARYYLYLPLVMR